MNKTFRLLLAVCLIIGCKGEKQPEKVDYSAIESKLIPAVIIEDSVSNGYSIEEQMEKYKVPAVSVAAFKDGEIIWAKAYGLKNSTGQDKTDKDTKFQAASISKPVTSVGVLKLIETYGLDLDADVNGYLKSWKVPEKFTQNEKVTLRRLLSHTSGTNLGGFQGYGKSDSIPDILGVIEGKGNSPQVKIDTVPGSTFSYSGGGYAILQLLIEDVSGKSFENYFQEEIFRPLNMTNSTFEQFPKDDVALAHTKDGKPHPDGWLVHPELAAAGLWTTPSDLAKFCVAIENGYHENSSALLSKKMVDNMLAPVKNWGLGVGLRGENDKTYFFHGGANPGSFKCLMVDFFKKRTGLVVMTNGENGDKVHDDILRSFDNFFGLNSFNPKYIKPIQLTDEQLAKLTGKYQYREMGEYFLEVLIDDSKRIVLYDPNDETKHTYVPLSKTKFVDVQSGSESFFVQDSLTGNIDRMDYAGAYTFHKVE